MSLALVGKAAGNSARGTRGDSLPYPNPADKGFGFLGFASISLARTCEDLTNFSRKVAENIKKIFPDKPRYPEKFIRNSYHISYN